MESEECSVKDIATQASWDYRMAARVGEKYQIRKTLELLEFLD